MEKGSAGADRPGRGWTDVVPISACRREDSLLSGDPAKVAAELRDLRKWLRLTPIHRPWRQERKGRPKWQGNHAAGAQREAETNPPAPRSD